MLQIINEVNLPSSASRQEKLRAMEPLYKKYNVHRLCEAMNVDRGTFYNYIFRSKKDNTWYSERREILREAILKAYEDSHQIYGAEKITYILNQQGYKTSRRMVSSLMNDMGITSIRHRAKNCNTKKKINLRIL